MPVSIQYAEHYCHLSNPGESLLTKFANLLLILLLRLILRFLAAQPQLPEVAPNRGFVDAHSKALLKEIGENTASPQACIITMVFWSGMKHPLLQTTVHLVCNFDFCTWGGSIVEALETALMVST